VVCGVVYATERTQPVRRRAALKVIKLGVDTKAVATGSNPSVKSRPFSRLLQIPRRIFTFRETPPRRRFRKGMKPLSPREHMTAIG
jgi:hypothetical protein